MFQDDSDESSLSSLRNRHLSFPSSINGPTFEPEGVSGTGTTAPEKEGQSSDTYQMQIAFILFSVFTIILFVLILYLRLKCLRRTSGSQRCEHCNVAGQSSVPQTPLFFLTSSGVLLSREQMEMFNSLQNELTIDLNTLQGFASIEEAPPLDLPPPTYSEILKQDIDFLPSYDNALKMSDSGCKQANDNVVNKINE